MNKKSHATKQVPRSMMSAFKSFVVESSSSELNEALMSEGEDGDELISKANSAIEKALSRVKQNSVNNDLGPEEAVRRQGLSALLYLLRKQRGLTLQQVADAADVDVEDIRGLEEDEAFFPGPRAIYQLEEFYSLQAGTLVFMCSTKKASSEFHEKEMKFAAYSKNIGTLTKDEKKELNEFVKLLAAEAKRSIK